MITGIRSVLVKYKRSKETYQVIEGLPTIQPLDEISIDETIDGSRKKFVMSVMGVHGLWAALRLRFGPT